MPAEILIEYLDRSNALYSTQIHSGAFTAPEIAELAHIHGLNFAKVVILKMESELAMIVLPANYQVDLDELCEVLDVPFVELATESEFSYRFPRCETGAMPPFGHLYGLKAYMVPVFDKEGDIAFNAGSHCKVIKMPYYSFLRLSHVVEISSGVIPPNTLPWQFQAWSHEQYR
jgi:Ala-tRNA(Pro) deacylase